MMIAARAGLVFAGLLFGVAADTAGQGGPQLSPERRAADSLLAAKKLAAAESAFVRLTVNEPDRSGHWFQLGMTRYNLQRFDEAARAFERANALQRNPMAQYNVASTYSRAGKPDLAFLWLDSVISIGFASPEQIEQDADFASLRGDARYAAALDRARRATTPCMFDANYRRLDFWLGSWDVKTIAGGLAGQSVVERIAGGCALLENWNPGRGRPGGKSINAWNPQLKQWQQYWVGGGGGVTEYRKGTWTDTSVVYISEITGSKGEPVRQRLTFAALKDGRVRQWAEQSVDGAAWTTQYDFYYERRKP